MALAGSYVISASRIPDLFNKIRDGQAPERFTNQLLKDWGFTSTNDRAFIPLLKTLGFLTADGKPTTRYNAYRDHSRSKAILGEALREAYSDIFLIKEHPTTSDKAAIEGKFKSFHNQSDNVAGLMTRTFFGLLALADLTKQLHVPEERKEVQRKEERREDDEQRRDVEARESVNGLSGLHYNIQIHLPATKDIEVYNAIFKSVKEHLFAK